VLRVQPELLRGGLVTVTLSAHASLGFPVAGVNLGAVRSGFGAERDGGRREHHGVDIFAPRGTPVVAAAAGYVTRVGTRGIGGNVVWMREARWGRRLYYAHLDRFAVEEDIWVEPGDTIGFVGNSGNARTTPPHLHFGIYLRGQGPVDPHFHLYEPERPIPAFAGGLDLLGRWARVAPAGAAVRAAPSPSASVLTRLQENVPVEVLAVTGRWYLARFPDGTQGYAPLSGLAPLEPLQDVTLATQSELRTAPTELGVPMGVLGEGATLAVLGWFGDAMLVRHPEGSLGWIRSPAIASGGAGAVAGSN
jgi:hypothetical protein